MRRKNSRKNSPHSGRILVADAGPLIALGRIELLWLLRELAETVLVPDVVAAECANDPSRPGARAIRAAMNDGLLTKRSAPVWPGVREPPESLGPGEAAVIALAAELRVPVLIDEKRARHIARNLGLRIVGTGGILIQAKQFGLLTDVRPVITKLRRAGYRMSAPLVSEIPRRCGEDE